MQRKFEYVNRIIDNGINMLSPTFELPKRSTENSAGYDFYNPKDITIPPYQRGDAPVMVETGVKAYMQNDEYLMLVNRSSNPKKKNLIIPNSIGIVDADYYENPDNDGEIMFGFYNMGNKDIVLLKDEKIGQGIFMKYYKTDDDNSKEKRMGGFGSTGK